MTHNQPNLGDLISLIYDEYLGLYGDEDIAAVAAAATINDMIVAAETVALEPVQADAA